MLLVLTFSNSLILPSSDKSGLKVTDCTVQSANYWCFDGTSYAVKVQRSLARCHGFVVHIFLLRMNKNFVDFRVMRTLCDRLWNLQAKLTLREPHSWDPRVVSRTLTAYCTQLPHSYFVYIRKHVNITFNFFQ